MPNVCTSERVESSIEKSRPPRKPVNLDGIPAELKSHHQWCLWKWEYRHGRWTKVPYRNPWARSASNDPDTWISFEDAAAYYQEDAAKPYPKLSGVGYFLREGSEIVGIDLDHCVIQGQPSSVAASIATDLDTYCEISPSNTGLRMLAHGKKPGGKCKRGNFECYEHTRFVTLTGDRIPTSPLTINERQAAIEEFYIFYISNDEDPELESVVSSWVPDVGIDRIVQIARHDTNFDRLFAGDWAGFSSHSDADFAFVREIIRYVGDNPEMIDAIFRRSGLYREKWDRQDYRERTINKALEHPPEPYTWDCLIDDIITPVDPADFVSDLREAEGQIGRRKRAYTISELASLPKPRWHVGGLFPEQSLVILWGQSGSGKTFLALEWALATATGTDWLGRPVKHGSAVYIAAEGRTGLPKRCLRWLEHHGQQPPGNFWVLPEAFELIQRQGVSDLVSVISQLGDEHALIVIDTLNKNLGGSENDGEVMSAFLRAAAALQERFKATVLVIHHTGWDSTRERGHSSLRCNADAMLSAAKCGTHLAEGIEIACIKQKDYDLFARFGVKGTIVGHGEDSSIVLTETFDPAQRQKEESLERRQEKEDQAIVQLAQHLPDEPNGLTVDELEKLTGLSHDHCKRTMRDAYNARYVFRTGKGLKSSPFGYYLNDGGKALVVKYEATHP